MNEEDDSFNENKELAWQMSKMLEGKSLGCCAVTVNFLIAKICESSPKQAALEFLDEVMSAAVGFEEIIERPDD